MPIYSTAARFKSLQNDYGPTRGINSPDSYTVHLWVGDPSQEGSFEMPGTTELEDASVVPNGYVPPTVSADSFVVDELGISAVVPLPDALEEWPHTITHWLLKDAATGEEWDYSLLSEPVDVTAAGPVQPIEVTVFYDDEINL